MTIINLKEMYSNYYIRQWKKEGLPLITERPPTTTQELLDEFFSGRAKTNKKRQNKAIILEHKRRINKKLDWKDYLKEG